MSPPPTEVSCCVFCLRVGWGIGKELGTLKDFLGCFFPCLFYFAKWCVFTGMYSGSSANHNGPSPGILPSSHDIPSRHHPLDSTLSSPHHHQSPLESAREGYVCETCLASVWHDNEWLIVYFTLHRCCSNEKHWPKLSILFVLESLNNLALKGPQKVMSSIPCTKQGKLWHYYQAAQGLVLVFNKTH